LPPRSPNLNAYVERFMRSLKEECLGRMIFFGEQSWRQAIRQFLGHYHEERNHQGLGSRLHEAGHDADRTPQAVCPATALFAYSTPASRSGSSTDGGVIRP
jgi:transposase InsO family protein